MILKLISISGLFCFLQGAVGCNPAICIRWKVTRQVFSLTCQITNLKFQVLIKDQNKAIVSHCVPPYPTHSCKSRIEGGMAEQKHSENAIIFSLNKTDTQWHINGNWTCLHGLNSDTEYIEVTVLGQNTIMNTINNEHDPGNETRKCDSGYSKSKERNWMCLVDIFVYGVIAYILGMVCGIFVQRCYMKQKKVASSYKLCQSTKGLKVIIIALVTTISMNLLICLTVYFTISEDKCERRYYMVIAGWFCGLVSGFPFERMIHFEIRDLNNSNGDGNSEEDGETEIKC